jgi:uncharacterized membrane protein YccF (DUF307 family)
MFGFLGNLIWFLFGGCFLGLGWLIVGVLWCCSIVGIPIGLQCFKIASIAFLPFGKDIYHGTSASSFFLNMLWIIFGGIELAITSFVLGILFCCTIIGIPFGKQFFKLAQIALMPFGARLQ